MSTYSRFPAPTLPPRFEIALDAGDTARVEWNRLPDPWPQEAPASAGWNVECGDGLGAPRYEPRRMATEDRSAHTERRRTPRGVQGFEPNRAQLVSMTLGNYQEMPGLSLLVQQAARLFGVSTRTCQVVLDDLVKDKRLRRDARGQYVL